MKLPQLKANLPVVLSLAIGLLFPALANSQRETPLGTVARQNRAQAKAKKVYTDEDMPTRASERGPSATTENSRAEAKPATADSETSAKSEAKAEERSKSETMETSSSTPESQDSNAAAPVRRKLNNLKLLENLLQKKIDQVQKAMADDSDPYHRDGYVETIEANKKSLADTRQQIAETEKELAEANK